MYKYCNSPDASHFELLSSQYNLTHPYFKLILNELKLEAGSEYEAISYDYRISQIVHEGVSCAIDLLDAALINSQSDTYISNSNPFRPMDQNLSFLLG